MVVVVEREVTWWTNVVESLADLFLVGLDQLAVAARAEVEIAGLQANIRVRSKKQRHERNHAPRIGFAAAATASERRSRPRHFSVRP